MYLKRLLVAIIFLGRMFAAGRPTEADMMAGKPLVRNKYMSPVVVHNADKTARESKNKHEKLNYRPVVNVQGSGRKSAGMNSQPYLQQEKYALVEILDEPHGYNFETEPIMMDEVTTRLMEHSSGGKDITKEETQPFGTTTAELRVSPPSTTAMSTVTRNETEPFLEIEDDVTLAGLMKGRKTISSETSRSSFTPNFTGNTKISPFQIEKFRLNNGTQIFAQDKTRIEEPGVIKTKEKGMEVPVVASYKDKLFEFPPGSKLIGNEYPAITGNKGKEFESLTPNKQKGFELPLLSKQTGFELPPLNRQKGFELPGITNYEDTGMAVPSSAIYKEKGIEVPDISKVKGIEVSAIPGTKGVEVSGMAEVRGNKMPVDANENGIKFPSILNYGQEDVGFPSVTKYKEGEVPATSRQKDITSHGMTREEGIEFPSITKDKEFYIPGVNKGNEIPSLTKQKGVEIPEKGMYIPGITKEKETGTTSVGKSKEMHLSNINNENEIVLPDVKSNREKGIEVPGINNYKMQYPSMNKEKGIDISDITNYKMKGINVPSVMTEKAIDIPGFTNDKMKGIDVPPIAKETGVDIPDITNYKMNAVKVPPTTKEKGSDILGTTDLKGKGAEIPSIMREKEILIPGLNNNKVKGIEVPFVNMDKGIAIPGITSYKTKENGATDMITEEGMYVTGITVYKGKGIEVTDISKPQRLKIPANNRGIDIKDKGIDTLSMFKMKGPDIPDISKEKEMETPELNELKELEIPAITKDKGINIPEKAKAKGIDALNMNKLNDIGVLPIGIDIPGMTKTKGSEVPTASKDKGIDMFGISRGIDIPSTEKVEGFEIPFIMKYKEIYTPSIRMNEMGIQNMNNQKGLEFPSISKEEIFENPGVNNEKGIEFPVVTNYKGIGTDVPNVAEIKGVDTSGVSDLKNGIRYLITNTSKPSKFSINNNSKKFLLKSYQNNIMYNKMGDRKSSPLVKQFRLRPSFNMTSRSIFFNPQCTQPYNVIPSYNYSGIGTKNSYSYRTEKNNVFGTQDHVGTYYILSSYKPLVHNLLFTNDVIFTTENPTFFVTTDRFITNYPFNFPNISDVQRAYFPEINAVNGTIGIFVPYPNATESRDNAELRMASRREPSEGGNYATYHGIDSLSEGVSNNVTMPVPEPFIFYNYSNNMVPSPIEVFPTKPTRYRVGGQINQEYSFNFNNELLSNAFTYENVTKLNDVEFNVGQIPVNTLANTLFNVGPKTSIQQLQTKSSVLTLERKRTTSESPFTENNAVDKALFDKILGVKTDLPSNYGTSGNVLDKEYVANAGDQSATDNSHGIDFFGLLPVNETVPGEKKLRANRLLNLKLSMMSQRTIPTPARKIIFELDFRGQKLYSKPHMDSELGRDTFQEYRSREDVENVTP